MQYKGKSKRNRSLMRPRCIHTDNMKTGVKEKVYENVDRTDLAKDDSV
jgi:hypothetical protein